MQPHVVVRTGVQMGPGTLWDEGGPVRKTTMEVFTRGESASLQVGFLELFLWYGTEVCATHSAYSASN